MFTKVLIANRGEIALRLIRACHGLGIRTVAVYSEADANAPHRIFAGESVLIGPAPPQESYLNVEAILSAARQTGADAIHPGYGFLSENAEFARACAEAGLTFIGPPPEAIAAMGDKAVARRTMQEAGVPIVPGSDGPISDEQSRAVADSLGYPVMLKAVAGGGGIGMARVDRPDRLDRALASARRRAVRAFGDDRVYLEKLIQQARHVEIQIAADSQGNAVAFPERECSVQRRHQKVLEETPSPAVGPDLRARMQAAALRAVGAIGYQNLGTVEFLLAPGGDFYFLEMNTRLQVEHGITELVTGVDLVQTGIRVAAGEPLPFAQADISLKGHALEARIYAEDPDTFLPSPGQITHLVEPGGEGIRLDSGVVQGQEITPHYDPLLAKLMAWGETRAVAVERLQSALGEYVVEGVKTNIPLHLRVLRDERFLSGQYDVTLVENLSS